MRKPIAVETVSSIAHVRRENLSSDALERLLGTEELELAANSGTAALMSQTDLDARGKIYSISKLRETLDDADDDTNECVKDELIEFLNELEQFHFVWLI